MKLLKPNILLMGAILLSCFSISIASSDGSLDVGIGYTYTDFIDNQSVNQETYNTYEGISLSFENIRFGNDKGYTIYGNLKNITLNNRNLNLSVFKPGLFSISSYHNKYRRIYDSNGDRFTRRESSGVDAYIIPLNNVKLTGGFYINEKDGQTLFINRPVYDSIEINRNYTQYSYNFGLETFSEKGKLSANFKKVVFQDDTDFSLDKEADQYRVTGSWFIPRYKNIILSGGYLYRNDWYNKKSDEIETRSYWGGFKVYFEKQVVLDYRILSSHADHSYIIDETNIMNHTVSLGKSWPLQGGVRFGYSFRIFDDDFERSKTNTLLADGWYKYNKWLLRGKYSSAKKEDDRVRTYLGDRETSRKMISVSYKFNNQASLQSKFENRIKRYDDLDSEADYIRGALKFSYDRKNLFDLVISAALSKGDFDNRLTGMDFEFSDKLIDVYLTPQLSDDYSLSTGITYYRSKRDIDIEKFNFNFTIDWNFQMDHNLRIRYHAFTYDDLLIIDNTYTANIVEVNIIKNINF